MIVDCSNHAQVSLAIETNMVQFRANFGRLPNSSLFLSPQGVSLFNPEIPHFIFNSVYGVRLNQADIATLLPNILDPYLKNKLPLAWWTGPASEPANLGKYLEDYDLVHNMELPGMAADIDTVLAQATEPAPIVIEQVTDTWKLRSYMQAFRGFGLSEQVSQPFAWLFEKYALEHVEPWFRFVGIYAGQAVAISELFLGAGVAGIYSVGTVPDYRKRGFGKALTLAALVEARRQGYKVAILHSSAAGYQMYRDMGFIEYCKLNQYLLTK